MDAAAILLGLVAVGVNFGWQKAENSTDGYEYIVQVEPELLDVLRSGESVPIESNVPPEVGPIRKVSLVVGRGDLPRDTVSAVERTAYFAGQGWAPGQTGAPPAAGSTYDLYGQPPASVIDRTQSAVTETGTALRDGVDAGIQAANQQLTRAGDQVMESSRNAGQEIGRQMQGFVTDPAGQFQSNANGIRTATEQAMNTVGNEMRQVNPFASASAPATSHPAMAVAQAQNGVTEPPWPPATTSASITPIVDATAAPGMTVTPTASGWTSIGSSVAAPPLVVPPLLTSPQTVSGPAVRTASSGPSFPATSNASNSPGALGSGWDTGAGASQATIGRGSAPSMGTIGNAGHPADLVQVQPPPGSQPLPTATGNNEVPWWDQERWSQPPQTPASQSAQIPQNQGMNSAAPRNPAADWHFNTNPAIAATTPPAGQFPPGNGSPSQQQASTGQSALDATTPQPPWLPLLVVSLSLVGSLSANLFLGWSYMDARQKYHSLVRKTADTFRRVTKAAA